MRSGAVTPWVTLETLAPNTLSVASVGEAPREFAAWERVVQRLLGKMPAVYDGMSTQQIAEAIGAVRDRAHALDRRIRTNSGPYLLRLRPVFGPAGDVHAIQLWLGPDTGSAPEPPVAVGAVWDLDAQTVRLPSGAAALPGMSPQEYVPGMSIAEIFHRMSAFDLHAEVLDLLYEPKPGDKMQFDVTVPARSGPTGRWRVTIRARDDRSTRGAWWLIEDVSAGRPAVRWPTLENVGLREAHRRAGNHLAVLQLEYTSISHWLTDPAPWIRWDYLFRAVDVFHSDDRGALAGLGDQLRTGGTAGMTLRVLNYSGGYTPTSVLLYPYPGYSARQLAIAQLVRVADGQPMLEARRSGPSAPVGYDDQLRCRLSRAAGRLADLPNNGNSGVMDDTSFSLPFIECGL
ncbi:hypothetical protein ABIA39_006225 [Nocardia sp. GAS34]|uniref:GAF domain-containing protein n=1 Tax=unclassified Nocardia TaxID=2637762 RepID=UPI003D23D804